MNFRWTWPAAFLAGLLVCLPFACHVPAPPPAPPDQTAPSLHEFQGLPQDPAIYLAGAGWRMDPDYQARRVAELRQAHFAPWRQNGPLLSAAEFRATVRGLTTRKGYGENTLPQGPEWGERLWALADPDGYPNAGWPGLTLHAGDLRSLPTRRPQLQGFGHAGEGLAFDRLQESTLPPGSPVWVCHASRDGAWLFCDTPIGSHWLAAEKVARVDAELMRRWCDAPLAAIRRDGVGLRDDQGRFVCQVDLGALLPLAGQDQDGLSVLAPRACAGQAGSVVARLAPDQAAPLPLELTPSALAKLAAPLLGQAYGWGGSFGGRDCSALVRDLFLPFGLWLPRNSRQQAEAGGDRLELMGLSAEEKEALILRQGRPGLSLLYLPGHIMLYLGQWEGRVVVMHALWGLRSLDGQGREGRWVVGRVVISDLWPGRQQRGLVPEGSEPVSRLTALVNLVPASALEP